MLRTDKFDGMVEEYLTTFPIVDSFKMAVVKLAKLKDLDTPFFKEFKEEGSENILIVIPVEVDKRTSFYKSLEKEKLIEVFDKSKVMTSIPAFLVKCAAARGAVFADRVCNAMLERCGYVDNEACNLYTLIGYVDMMASISNSITMELMNDVVPDFHKEEIFTIAKMILKKDIKGLRLQAELANDEISILSLLLREYRIAYKVACGYKYKDIGISFKPVFADKNRSHLLQGMSVLTDTIAALKKGGVIKSTCLLESFVKLMSA